MARLSTDIIVPMHGTVHVNSRKALCLRHKMHRFQCCINLCCQLIFGALWTLILSSSEWNEARPKVMLPTVLSTGRIGRLKRRAVFRLADPASRDRRPSSSAEIRLTAQPGTSAGRSAGWLRYTPHLHVALEEAKPTYMHKMLYCLPSLLKGHP